MIERLDVEVVWIEPGGGNSPSGTFNGPDSVGQEVSPAVGEYFEEFRAEPENYDDQEDTIVVTGRFKGRRRAARSWTPPSSTSTR